MKNKLEGGFITERFTGELPVDIITNKPRRGSMAPKIVVCPPVEEMSETLPRGTRLLKALSRRLQRRNDDDSLGSSSSNESMSCDTGRSEDPSSCSNSDSGSDECERRRRHRSTVSLRRVFQNLSISTRSQSTSPSDRNRQPKKQTQPKRILRPPITYTYVRGLSGLPTQRVPRNMVCTSVGLNR